MHWLPALDTALFRLVNLAWSNPFFDRVMPWLSGNVLFLPFLLAAVGYLIWRFRLKGALCVAMLLLIVPLGDSFVSSTIKRAISRPRPFVTLSDATQRVGTTSPYASMPSSHAANWFAATMILGIYFRRSVRVMLPLAVAVSYSRVYNGVHYPADVLAGAILGAGYGAAGVFTIQTAWRWLGKKFFPRWHEQLPSLIAGELVRNSAERSGASAVPSELNDHWLRAGYLLILILTLARWGYLASGIIELSEDEAYQWHWSKHLALSYYSKPPLIAYTQFLGTSLWGDNAFGVRFFSPLIAATLGVMLLRFFAREVSARVGFYLVLMVTAAPLLSIGATLMTVDPLSVLFWTAAMLAGWRAIRPEAGTRAWFWVGLWMGMGFLSKYTELFQIPCWAVFFALWRPARVHLRRPGPWLALAVNALAALPVILWNQQHHWITATHVAGNAGLDHPWHFNWENIFYFITQEVFLLNPVFYFSTAWAVIAFGRAGRNDPRLVYFFSMGVPVFLVYLGWAFYSRVLPNWIAPAILPLFCLNLIYWEQRHERGGWFVRPWQIAGVVFGVAVALLLHDTAMIGRLTGVPVAAEYDPMRRVRGWQNAATMVGAARTTFEAEGKPVFIIGGHYGITSLISFYLPEARARVPDDPLVYFRSATIPENQFFFWPGYEHRKGQNALYVTRLVKPAPVPESLQREFETVTPVADLPVLDRGQVLHVLQIFECRNLR